MKKRKALLNSLSNCPRDNYRASRKRALRIISALFVALLSIVLFTSIASAARPAGKPETGRTFSARQLGVRELLKMDDTKKAAGLLKQRAAQLGVAMDAREKPRGKGISRSAKREAFKKRTKYLVRLANGEQFIPTPGIESDLNNKVRALTARKGREKEKFLCLIQFKEGLALGDVVELLEADVRMYTPAGRNTVIANIPASSIKTIRSRDYVRWIGRYKLEYKFNPKTLSSPMPGAMIYPLDGDKPEYRTDLVELGVVIRAYDELANFYDVILDASKFDEVAQLWWVRELAKEAEIQLHEASGYNESGLNFEPDDSREIINAFRSRTVIDDTNTGYEGRNVKIGVYDTGLWHYNAYDWPVGTYEILGGVNVYDDQDVGHGTHVAGTIASRGGVDIEGEHDGRGVADEVKIYMAHLNSYSTTEAFSWFYSNAIQVSNHSWGIIWDREEDDEYKRHYSNHTTNIDAYADDSDMVMIFSAGNEGDTDTPEQTIGNPGLAKNVITVGAIRYVTDTIDSSHIIGTLSSYSSQGPTIDDLRLKPDLVAPGGDGTGINNNGVVANNNSFTNDDGNGTIWPTNFWYTRMSGTSMAAPHVTGVCALIKEKYPFIESEQLKALLINTTIPLKGNTDDALAGYANTKYGYGMVNAFSVTDQIDGEDAQILFAVGTVTDEDTNHVYNIEVPNGTWRLAVTMAYNDQEGAATVDHNLMDNLDLILVSPDCNDTYIASERLAPGVVTESPLEKMVIENPAKGEWKVIIEFVDSPGFDNPLFYSDQRYGVVANAIMKMPEITFDVPEKTIDVPKAATFYIQPTITNTGGYIAAGVTLKTITSGIDASVDDDTSVTYRAVICGISDYSTRSDLFYADNDAMDIYSVLLTSSCWDPANIELLIDSAATKSAIQSAIESMGTASDTDDVCVFYFSGHGTAKPDVAPFDENDTHDEYLCTYADADISDDELGDWMAALPTSRYMVLIDSCYSGGTVGATIEGVKGVGSFTPEEGDGFLADFVVRSTSMTLDLDDNDVGEVVTSCAEGELSWEDHDLENGVFTYYLVQALYGDADINGDGWISGPEAHTYAAPKTTNYSPAQHPQLYVGDGTTAPTGEASLTRYVGNLIDQGDFVAPKLGFTSRDTEGTYTITLYVDGINREFDTPEYPKTITVTVNVTNVDIYEPDNTYTDASVIAPFVPQTHSIIGIDDIDWVKFSLEETSQVIIETNGVYEADTRLWLYEYTDNITLIEYNDDSALGGTYYSRIDRMFDVDELPPGDYVVKVDDYGNNDEIPNYTILLYLTPESEQGNPPTTITGLVLSGGIVPKGGENDRVTLKLFSREAVTADLYASDDLVNWELIQTGISIGIGHQDYVVDDVGIGTKVRRYYRLKINQ
jgi:subtilisin family serine protease